MIISRLSKRVVRFGFDSRAGEKEVKFDTWTSTGFVLDGKIPFRASSSALAFRVHFIDLI